ncbi:hypothetical protein [Aeromicrobium sp.]|uniref:hypothetical protein n=1 Tax=Aeromicrobium sp. TaxID=1871063 RepID=UPI003D6B243D
MTIADVRELAVSLGIAATVAVVLRSYFRAFEFNWPEHYFGPDQGLELFVTRSLPRYAVFRLLPVVLALLVAGALASRLELARTFTILVSAGLYAAVSIGPDLARSLFGKPRKWRIVGMNIVLVAGVAAAAVIIALAGSGADSLVPPAREFVFAIWISVFVFIASKVALVLSSRPRVRDLVAEAEGETDKALMERLDEADPGGLFRAVAVAEHLNRPKWMRMAERLLRPRDGTYGLMQMKSAKPISDTESVLLFIDEFADHVPQEDEYWDEKRTGRVTRKHNRSEEFQKLVYEIMQEPGYPYTGGL